MNYSFENKNPLWHVHEGLVPRTNQIVVDDQIVNVYPDDNGVCGTTTRTEGWCQWNELQNESSYQATGRTIRSCM